MAANYEGRPAPGAGTYGTSGTPGTPSTSGGAAGGAAGTSATERSADQSRATSSTSGTSGSLTAQASDMASQAKDQVQQKAGDMVNQAKDEVASKVEDQKNVVADQVHSVAEAIRTSGKHLRDQDNGGSTMVAQFIDQGAQQLDRLSGYLRDRDINQFLDDAQYYARRNPELFVGGALLLGFLGARFLKSSSDKAYERGDYRGRYSGGGYSSYGYGYGAGSEASRSMRATGAQSWGEYRTGYSRPPMSPTTAPATTPGATVPPATSATSASTAMPSTTPAPMPRTERAAPGTDRDQSDLDKGGDRTARAA